MSDATYTDRIIVKVVLSAPPGPNESSIQKEWAELLGEWCEANECEVARIEWTRLRQCLVEDVSLSGETRPSLRWDVVEESK